MDRKRELKDEATSTDPSGESVKRPRSSQGKSLGKSEEVDQKPVDEEDFKKLHLAIEKGHLDTVRGIVDNRAVEQEEMKEMLFSCDKHGRNLLHSLFRWNTSERIIDILNLVKKCLADDMFEEFLKSKNEYSSNIFHLTTENRNVNFAEILTFCNENLETEEMKEMLISLDKNGRNLLHSLFESYSSEEIIDILNLVKKCLADEDMFEEFLQSKNKYSSNIFHLTTENRNVNFAEILTFCNENLEKEEMKEMLISLDKHGRNLLHSLFRWNTSERIIEFLNLIKKYLDDEDLFKESLKSKDKYSMNIFHLTAENRNEVNISFLKSHLSKSEIKKLLIESDEYGRTLLHCRAYWYPKKLLTLLHYSLETLEDDQLQLKKLILAKNRFKNTFLQEVVKSNAFSYSEQIVIEIIESLKEKVPDKLFKKLLKSRNIWQETFLQIEWRRRNEKLIEETAKVLEKDFIAQLLEKEELENASDSDVEFN